MGYWMRAVMLMLQTGRGQVQLVPASVAAVGSMVRRTREYLTASTRRTCVLLATPLAGRGPQGLLDYLVSE